MVAQIFLAIVTLVVGVYIVFGVRTTLMQKSISINDILVSIVFGLLGAVLILVSGSLTGEVIRSIWG